MKTRDYSEVTAVLVYVLTVALIAWDIYVINNGKPGSSISSVMYKQGCRHPLIVLGLGIILGHLYWPNPASFPTPPASEAKLPESPSQVEQALITGESELPK